jgi:large subunit ribosomal protein L21
MRAIIESGGMQIPVEVDNKCRVPLLKADIGQEIEFDKVLFISTDDKPAIGNPYIKGATVKGEIARHGKAEKVTVFKFRRRVKYRRKRGHRQDFTEVLIKSISH